MRNRIDSLALGLIALFMLPVAIQAAFAPKTWFEDFPFDRGWISASGDAYNEHLVRDVGTLFLALIIVTVWAAWKRQAVMAVAAAWLVQGVLHLWFHAGHLDGLEGTDKVLLLGSLVAIPVLAAVALFMASDAPWAARRSQLGRRSP